MTWLTRMAMMLALVAGTACATSARQVQSNDPPVLSGEEIASVSVQTAYDAIARLRPSYLRVAGGGQVVYMNTHVVGGVEALRDIPAYRVQEIRFLEPAEARRRLGSGHEGGAIIVVTRPTN